ncbi:MAG TPA: LLM class flavin-dependent oxidoreductase [Nitrolancea sp.]|jgi:alkanesulfonate monooxygenase SsuD/methylene tetrahydromethanopterin reductase-like flavin-dependent oxidoreductase (luciferase family)|nr:LLM class flavin-dependent oxidoreductase [Nitrolancea sp.]
MQFGVTLPVGVVGTDGRVKSYAEIRALAQSVERTGLDSIWIYDHFIFHFSGKPREGVWESWTILSGLAEATERVTLGNIVICTAHRNPAVLAKMAVTLDEMSDHRLILGLGAGWNIPAFEMFGLPYDHLVDRFEEALKIITPLVRDGKVDFRGTYSSAIECEILPSPGRSIPVMIGANRPRMMRLTAQFADSWNANGLGQVAGLTPKRAALEAAAAEVGRDPASLEVTGGVNIAFPDLGPVPAGADDPAKYLGGSIEELAEGLRGYVDAGVGHVMAWLYPLNDESIARYAAAADLARA